MTLSYYSFLHRSLLHSSVSIFFIPISKMSKIFQFYMVSIFFLLGIFIFNSHFSCSYNRCLFSIVKLVIIYTWKSSNILFVCIGPNHLIISEVFSIYPLVFLIQYCRQMIIFMVLLTNLFLNSVSCFTMLTRTFRNMLNYSKRKNCIGDSGLWLPCF